jgi:hypothetical protein
MAQCKATKRGGKRCEAYAVKGSDFCLTHAPDRARERAERNRRGGLARVIAKASAGAPAPKIGEIGDVLGLVNSVIGDVWLQENTAPRARALLAAAAQAIECLQIGQLEERVKALEDVLKAR